MNKFWLYGAIAAALMTASCASTRPVHYYTLTPPASGGNPAKPGGPVMLVGAIATPESLQDARIRYHTGANETGSYEYHRWEERPGAIVRLSLVRALRATSEYQRVLESSSAAVGDYLLRGKLYEFAEVDHPAVATKIALHLELVDEAANRVVWDHLYRAGGAGERQEHEGCSGIDGSQSAACGGRCGGGSRQVCGPEVTPRANTCRFQLTMYWCTFPSRSRGKTTGAGLPRRRNSPV